MGTTSKRLALVLILLLLSLSLSLLVKKPASAQSTPTPSVPEFTLQYEHGLSNQPATYSVNPYTGENVTVSPAQQEPWADVLITITNQPFTPYNDSNDNLIELYYAVQTKGHFSTLWNPVYSGDGDQYVAQSKSGNTTSELNVDGYPANAQVDFRVQAMIGYFHDVYSAVNPGNGYAPVFVGETSNWSSTQTITVPTSSSPTPSSAIPEISNLAIIALLTSVILIAVILRHRKTVSSGKQIFHR